MQDIQNIIEFNIFISFSVIDKIQQERPAYNVKHIKEFGSVVRRNYINKKTDEVKTV